MLGRIVERNRAIQMRSPVYDVPCMQQGQAHEAMPHHEWPRRFLLFCEGQEFDSKLTHQAVEDPQAQIFGSFPTVEHPTQGRFRTVAPPLQMSGYPLDGTAPAPALSADTEAVLREIGVSDEDLALLLAAASK